MFLPRKPFGFLSLEENSKDKQSPRKNVTFKMTNQIIGISGVAGSGKDTFYSLLAEALPCTQYSLADELKQEVNQWCKMHYRIDSVACSREEKETIRPFLVAHGLAKRKLSNGRHWIEKLHDKLIKDKIHGFKVITDVRYDHYENDEADWLKDELNGVLVHVSQYTLETPSTCVLEQHPKALIKKFKEPANSEEAQNDPKVKLKSDYQVEWPFLENNIDKLSPYVDNFIKWLSNRKI